MARNGKTLIPNTQIGMKLKLTMWDSLIGSILVYGLNAIHINDTQAGNYRPFIQDV